MWKKIVLPALFLVVAVILFVLYRKQHHLYLKTLKLNHELTAEINNVRQENETFRQTIQQMQRAKATSALLRPTFVDQQKYYRQNWQNYIQVSLNDYATGLLGGIHDLKISVKNRTDYALDQVSIQIQYLRSNGKLFKTETVTLNRIAAQKQKQITAPDSRRGMSVKADFIKITSREMNFCWSVNKKVKAGDEDPYRCAGAGT